MKMWNENYSQKDFIQIYWVKGHWMDIIDFKKLKKHLDNQLNTHFEHFIIPGPNSKSDEEIVYCQVGRENGRVEFDYTTDEVKKRNEKFDLYIGKMILHFNNESMVFIKTIEWLEEMKSPYDQKTESNWYYENLFENPKEVIDELNRTDKETEKESIIQSRLKQGEFRENLVECFNRKCPISGIDNLELLVASHIKPWSKSNNPERLDPNNGLLLAVHLDKLFDRGYISFGDDGSIMLSKDLDEKVISFYNLAGKLDAQYLKNRIEYMQYHRDNIFRK
jgi:hypothetical protein